MHQPSSPSLVEAPDFRTIRPFLNVSWDSLVLLARYAASFCRAGWRDMITNGWLRNYCHLSKTEKNVQQLVCRHPNFQNDIYKISQVDVSDAISINDLVLPVSLQTGAQWPLREAGGVVQQPISISLSFLYNVQQAASSDDITRSINYSYITKELRNAVLPRQFESLQDLAINVAQILKILPMLQTILDGLQVQIKVTQLKAPLHCKTIGLEYLATFSSDGAWTASKIYHSVGDLTCPTIIGVNPAERLEKQDIVVNLSIGSQQRDSIQNDWLNLRNLTKVLYEVWSLNFLYSIYTCNLPVPFLSDYLGFFLPLFGSVDFLCSIDHTCYLTT